MEKEKDTPNLGILDVSVALFNRRPDLSFVCCRFYSPSLSYVRLPALRRCKSVLEFRTKPVTLKQDPVRASDD